VLPGKPLAASAEAHAFRNYYTCGLAIQLAIDAEAKRSSAGARSLFAVWAQFLARVRGGEPFNQDTFLHTAADLGAVHAAAFAHTLASVAQRDPLPFLRAGLNEAR
jgi:predicted metalloprotease with PDZ domain